MTLSGVLLQIIPNSPYCLSWNYSLPLLSIRCVDLEEHQYNVAVQNLIYRCRSVHLIILVNSKWQWFVRSNMHSTSLKWSFNPSQTTLTEQVEQMYVRGMKSTCSGFFYYTVPYYNIQYLLKFRNRQYTGMSVTMSQGGWRRKIPSGYLILYSKHILQPS